MKPTKVILRDLLLIIVLLTLFISVGQANAALPQTMNYQGYLTNPSGTPIDGTINMSFYIYDVSSGGNALWSESQSVAINKGIYTVVLGNVTPIGLPFDVPYWLGVKVGTNAEMTPRQPLTSVAYSFRAKTADVVAGGAVTTTTIADGAVTASKIGEPCADGQILKKSGANWVCADNIPPSSYSLNYVDTSTNQTISGNKTFSGTTTLSTPLEITSGGTGQSSRQAAIDALLPDQGSASGKFLTSNGISSSWSSVDTGFVAGDNYLLYSLDTARFTNWGYYILLKSIAIPRGGVIRVSFTMKGDSVGHTYYGRIYKNGVAVGTERTTSGTSQSTFTEDLVFSPGDTIEVRGHTDVSGSSSVYVSNFRLYATAPAAFITITDTNYNPY
jgi:hypothetical protein